VSKRISLVVTYDTETEKSVVDVGASSILFPEGPCWDDELSRWVEEPALVDTVTRGLEDRLREGELSGPSAQREAVPVETKFIELALNIIDPDGAWDPEETLAFGDAARAYLSEFPITEWEIEGAFALVAQFVHDCAMDKAQGADHSTNASPASVASQIMSQNLLESTATATKENEDPGFEGLASLETEDPLSGAKLRMLLGDFEGVPTLALFVGEDDEPILIDRSALHIAIEQWWESRNDGDRPALSFLANADQELEVISLDIDVESTFE
jgi:hypothetical protein